MKPYQYGGIILILCAIILVVCCVFGSSPGSPTLPALILPDPLGPGISGSVSASEQAVTEGNTRFALDFYRSLRTNPRYADSNIFFSPYSMSTAFSLAGEGARGKTADEIRTVFHLPENPATRREGNARISEALNNPQAGYTLHTANALWAEKSYPFLPEYLATAAQYYHADATNVDFISHPEESRQEINRWTEAKTENKIHDLIPTGVITPLTRLVITNAVYFRGTWEKEFNKDETTDAPFRKLDGTKPQVRMMQRGDHQSIFGYVDTWTYQAIELPYTSTGGKHLSMLVILPKGDDLTSVENSLSPGQIAGIRKSLTSRWVKVYFPKFSLDTTYALPGILGTMGMPTAFGGGADLSGMDGSQMLSIGDAIHKATIDVNEEGTEAAAATAVAVTLKGDGPQPEKPPEFRADHPFIFLIQDTESGNILFMGRVVNPSS